MSSLVTLTVERTWESSYNQITTLKDCNGKVKAIFSSSIRQPKRAQKEIKIKETVYLLDWSNVSPKYVRVKDRV